MTEKKSSTTAMQVSWHEVGKNELGQRLDNFLFKTLKGVPKSRIYRALRGGEVRVNKSRKKPHYQLKTGDLIRIPPMRVATREEKTVPAEKWQTLVKVLFEDEHLLILNKPSGLAVHGGSGLDYGLIEAWRYFYPQYDFLELCHRLDRETSGILVLAKNRVALTATNDAFHDHVSMQKHYLALVKGKLNCQQRVVRKPLAKSLNSKERHMLVDAQGQSAQSVISTQNVYQDATLVNIELITGRTHQARVHMASIGHSIAADWQYGDSGFNKTMRSYGLKRLFLHAHRLKFSHPVFNKNVEIECPLPTDLDEFIQQLKQ